jgi:hypothetical protein
MINTNQQFQALPHSPVQPQYQFVQINVNNCPVNLAPLQTQIHPGLVNYLVPIAVTCINELQNKATQNSLRLFLFNQMAANTFNNQLFLQLMKSVLELVECTAEQGVQLESAIEYSVEMTIQLYALNNLYTYPSLNQYVDPNTQAGLQRLQKKQSEVLYVLSQHQQQKAMRQQQMSPYGFQRPQMLQQNGISDAFQQQSNQSWQTKSTGLFSSPIQTPAVSEPQNGTMVDGWAAAAQNSLSQINQQSLPTLQQAYPFHQEQTPFKFNTSNNAVPAAQAESAKVNSNPVHQQYEKFYHHPDGKLMVKHGDPGVKFKMTKKWPFAPSPSNLADVYYVLHEDGSMEPIIKKLTKEQQMEKSRHYAITSTPTAHSKIWGSVLAHGAAERREEADNMFESGEFEKGIKTDLDFKKSSVNKDEIVKDEVFVAVISEGDAWSQTDISLSIADRDDKKCTAYVKPVLRVKPIVSKCDTKDLVDSLKECTTLEQCASKLKAENYSIKSLSDVNQRRQRQTVFGKINRTLTESLNHYLKYKLALGGVQVGSFEDDGGELIQYLKDEYPEQYAAALSDNQAVIIRTVLSTTSDDFVGSEFEESLKEQYLSELDIGQNNSLFLYRKEFFMSINMFSAEINEHVDDQADTISVFSDSFPRLYSLCEHLSSCAKSLDENEDYVYSYYMKTLDDVVYVVNRSALRPTTFIVGLK